MGLILAVILGYLLGSIPSGLLIARAMDLPDPRGIGSGNIGATNVLRTGDKRAAAATLLGDAAKGIIAVLLVRLIWGDGAALLAAIAAFAGHCWPVWLGFRGGKGVATFLGILLALSFWAGLVACLTWLATAAVMRISSLSALVAAAAAPIFVLMAGPVSAVWAVAVLAVLIFWRHRPNIDRLRAGTEPRIGQS